MKLSNCLHSVFLTLSMGVAAVLIAGPAAAQSYRHPLQPRIAPADAKWQQAYPATGWLGGGNERVAVVVWDDMNVAQNERLYALLSSSIDAYAQDVAAAGFKVAVFKFYGMAEDPDPNHSTANDLRKRLYDLWAEPESLAGTVLVGNVPYLLFEYFDSTGRDIPSDILLADLDATITDELDESDVYIDAEDVERWPWRKGALDNWEGDQQVEIWISRIIARPALVNFVNDHCSGSSWTQESILESYFSRDALLRWGVFNTDMTALLFSYDSGGTIGNDMAELFGPNVTPMAPPDWGTWTSAADVYLEALKNDYAHISINGYHGMEEKQIGPLYTWQDQFYVHREHYVVAGFDPDGPGGMPTHTGCEDPQTMSYFFGTCLNGSFAYFPPPTPPGGTGACCLDVGLCEILSDYNCWVEGGAFQGPQTSCTGNCTTWSPPWPPQLGEACIAEVAAFNTDCLGLIAVGHSRTTGGASVAPDYFATLRDGGCAGEGWKQAFNKCDDPMLKAGLVMLGDGTLKSGLRWSGDGATHIWSIGDNWSAGRSPNDQYPENVLHNNADEIQVDAAAGPIVNVRRFDGNGAEGGGLRINAGRHLETSSDATFTATYDVTLDPGVDPQHPTQFSIGGTLSGGNFSLNDYSELTAGLDSVAQTVLDGDWTLDGPGASATFWNVSSATPASAVNLTLTNESQLTLRQLPAGTEFFGDGKAHRLLYGPGENALNAGWHENGEEFYVGDQTIIAGSGADPQLDLYMRCSFPVSSDFQYIAADWNTTGVDVTMNPIDGGQEPQGLELISPDLRAWFTTRAVIFVDVPCTGAFRDLNVEGAEASGNYAALHFANDYDNSAIDEGPASSWTPRSGPGSAELGFYRCVAIGGNRELRFDISDGLVYYWGTLTYYPSTEVYLNGQLVAVGTVIKPAKGAYYGDWNGDCRITQTELSALQTAIAGGDNTYNPKMDCNCDGVLQGGNNGAELALFLHNYTYHQSCAPTPDCGGESLMGGGMEESAMFAGAGEGLEDGLEAAVDDSEPVDTAALAAWLAEQLTPEQLAAFMADATTAAQAHADDGIGADIMELLTYLP
jgi:hypothetical protein